MKAAQFWPLVQLKFSVIVSKRAEAEEFRRPTETIAASKIEMNRRPATPSDSSPRAEPRFSCLQTGAERRC